MAEGHAKDNVVGYLGDANILEWSNTVQKVKWQYPHVQIVISGHGAYGDKKILYYTLSLFKTL